MTVLHLSWSLQTMAYLTILWNSTLYKKNIVWRIQSKNTKFFMSHVGRRTWSQMKSTWISSQILGSKSCLLRSMSCWMETRKRPFCIKIKHCQISAKKSKMILKFPMKIKSFNWSLHTRKYSSLTIYKRTQFSWQDLDSFMKLKWYWKTYLKTVKITMSKKKVRLKRSTRTCFALLLKEMTKLVLRSFTSQSMKLFRALSLSLWKT